MRRFASFLVLPLVACADRQPCSPAGEEGGPRVRLDIGLGGCNLPPSVQVAFAREAKRNDEVSLDATKSRDPNGDAVQFTWRMAWQPDGSAASLIAAQGPATGFTADASGAYGVELVVTDGTLSALEQLVIVAENDPPVANAGPDVQVGPNMSAVFDGSGSEDPNGDILSYHGRLRGDPAAAARCSLARPCHARRSRRTSPGVMS